MSATQWAYSWATVHGKHIGRCKTVTISNLLVGPWMGCPFTDLGAEGCCHSLYTLLFCFVLYCTHVPTFMSWKKCCLPHASHLIRKLILNLCKKQSDIALISLESFCNEPMGIKFRSFGKWFRATFSNAVSTWFGGLRYNNKTVLLSDTVHQISRGESVAARLTAGQPRPLTPGGRSGGPYHVTTQFYFYPVMSKIQNSINVYPWIWRRLTCPTQDFGNP